VTLRKTEDYHNGLFSIFLQIISQLMS